MTRMCAIEGCERGGRLRRGWCDKHYTRWRNHGDPMITRRFDLSRGVEPDPVPVGTHEVAWAAGFFDGEGWVGSTVNGKAGFGRVRMTVGQLGRGLLDRFAAIVGGGRVNGPNPQGMFTWETGNRVLIHQTCWLLWPYLGEVKRQQFHQAFGKLHELNAVRTVRR